MWKRMMRWCRGYVLVELRGAAQERFFNLCRRHNIYLWNIYTVADQYFCCMDLSDFRVIKKIARKAKVRPWIVKRIGLPFCIYRMGKQKGVILGFVSGIMLMYGLSLFLWDISFTGQSYYTEEQLLSYLNTIQIHTGIPIHKINCQDIEEQIRISYPNIGWVSTELEGTKLSISILETRLPTKKTLDDNACHMIASEKGKIVNIVTRQGVPLVKKGDKVKKGQILISGVLGLQNDDGTLKKKEGVHADGDIQLRTTQSITFTCDRIYKVKNYTGYEKKILELKLFNKKIYFLNPLKGFDKAKKYDIIANVCNVSVSKSFILPLSYGQTCYRQYEEVEARYTLEQAKKILQEQSLEYMKKAEQQKQTIEKKREQYKTEKDKVSLQVEFVIEKPVTTYKEITAQELSQEENNELSGDND